MAKQEELKKPEDGQGETPEQKEVSDQLRRMAGGVEGDKSHEQSALENDGRFKAVFEEESLRYLKTEDARWFFDNFSGDVSKAGYLIDKNGKETSLLPSQNVTGGYEKVMEATRKRLEGGK